MIEVLEYDAAWPETFAELGERWYAGVLAAVRASIVGNEVPSFTEVPR